MRREGFGTRSDTTSDLAAGCILEGNSHAGGAGGEEGAGVAAADPEDAEDADREEEGGE